MAEVDILMQEKQDDGSYNKLYPITNASNVNYTNSSLSGVSNAQQGLDSIVNTLGNINLNNYFTKTQTLTSSTAALFGLGADAVPNDVLALLGRFNSGLCNEYVWSKESTVWEPYLDTNNTSGTKYIYFYDKKKVLYSDEVIADSSGVTLKNPTTITVTLINHGNLAGKYFRFSTDSATNVRVFNRSTNSSDYVEYTETPVKSVSVQKIVGYVNSPDPDAYPPSVPDEYTYIPLGKLGNFARMETGSYIGTGKYGADNPNSLTFKFVPKFVLIFWAENGSPNNAMAFLSAYGGISYQPAGSNGQWFYASGIEVKITGTTITWYASSSQIQMNGSAKYQYLAIG